MAATTRVGKAKVKERLQAVYVGLLTYSVFFTDIPLGFDTTHLSHAYDGRRAFDVNYSNEIRDTSQTFEIWCSDVVEESYRHSSTVCIHLEALPFLSPRVKLLCMHPRSSQLLGKALR
ncbi:hypothetical protein COOONC_07402 [Cooperia oncophora]